VAGRSARSSVLLSIVIINYFISLYIFSTSTLQYIDILAAKKEFSQKNGSNFKKI